MLITFHPHVQLTTKGVQAGVVATTRDLGPDEPGVEGPIIPGKRKRKREKRKERVADGE